MTGGTLQPFTGEVSPQMEAFPGQVEAVVVVEVVVEGMPFGSQWEGKGDPTHLHNHTRKSTLT